MKFLKKNIKLILGIIIGGVLLSGISVYATAQYLASNVGYTKSGTNVSTVADALNDLYSKLPTKQNVQISQSATGINVSDALTIDTSSLYPKSGDGQGVFYKTGTITLDANGSGMISGIGFIPYSGYLISESENGTEKACIKFDYVYGGYFLGTNGDFADLPATNEYIISMPAPMLRLEYTSYWKNATINYVLFKSHV